MARVFFGLEISDEVARHLLAVRQPLDGARWQSQQQLHLTLAFLGEVQADAVSVACQLARQVQVPPFSVDVQGLGRFGPVERPRILWAGVAPEQPVHQLHEQLAGYLREAGFRLDNHPFKPHITLSRFRGKGVSLAGLLAAGQGRVFGALDLTEFVLFESTPGGEGSVYKVLERFPLVC